MRSRLSRFIVISETRGERMFKREVISDKIQSISEATSDGCWISPTEATNYAFTDQATGARYSRTVRQWAYYVATGIDPYRKGVTKTPACGNRKCFNPDHQYHELRCVSEKPETIKISPVVSTLKLVGGAVKWWN